MLTIYTYENRKEHLTELKKALGRLCSYLEDKGLFLEYLGIYESLKHDIEKMLQTTFSKSELSELSRAIPDIYFRHKDWMPPLEKTETGYREPDWFEELETYLQPVLKSARLLRETGYY